MKKQSVVTLCLVFAAGVVCIFTVSQTQDFTAVTNQPAIKFLRDLMPSQTRPYVGERRFPVVKKTPHPLPGFQSDVYLNFDTSRYIDSDGRVFIPNEDIMNNMTRDELEELYYRYIENLQIICPRMRHIGNDYDGGYHVCEPALPNDCLAYSFGNRKDYSFDDGLAFHYNCEVHSFDPNDGQPDHQHGELVEFHHLGISGKDEITPQNWNLKTFDSIRKMLGHEDRPLDLLKIDIEGGEWNSIPQILKTNGLERAHVKLIIVEFHILFTKQDRDAYLLGLRTLRDLYEAGFRIYYFRIWTVYCHIRNKKTDSSGSSIRIQIVSMRLKSMQGHHVITIDVDHEKNVGISTAFKNIASTS